MSKRVMLPEKNLTQVDDVMLKTLQAGGNEWKTRRQLQRLIGADLNTGHFTSLNRLEQREVIEIRQGKNKVGMMRWEYRAKDKG